MATGWSWRALVSRSDRSCAALGVPLESVIDEFEALQTALDEVAGRFTRLFESYLWAPFVEAGLPPEGLPDLTADLQHLSQLAGGVVASVLRKALKRAASGFLAEQAERLEQAGLTELLNPLACAAGLEVL